MEFIERLSATDGEERWLVHTNGETRVAWVLLDYDRQWLERTEHATRPLHGPIHPRIATIYAAGWQGDRLVFVIQDDRGPTLADAAAQLTDPIERERWAIAQIIGIADALATVRQRDRNFIHRQIEPQKLFVDVSGHLCLRAPIAFVLHGPRPMRTGAGVVKGFPDFMAPEQALGGVPTAATDVFALAGNLYHALSGKKPFTSGESFMATLQAIIDTEPPPIATHSPNLAAVLARAFAKAPADRTPDPGTFAGELWQCVPDAIDYDEVVSDKIVAWRATADSNPPREPVFADKCRMKWEQLSPIGPGVRHCGECDQEVVHARSLAAIVPLVGRCVSYEGGD